MQILLIDNGTTLLEKLERLVPGAELIRTWREFSQEDVDRADAIVLSGGSKMQLPGNEDEFKDELGLIVRTQKPLIGICFGCELITEAFGGTLKRLPVSHKGIRDIELLEPDLLDGKRSIRVFENHGWTIDTMPPKFKAIARSEDGPEMIHHESLPIWGMQCHPENYVDTTQGDDVFLRILNKTLSHQDPAIILASS